LKKLLNRAREALTRILLFVINIPNFIQLYIRLMLAREVPLRARAVLWVAAIYVISPLDIIPGFLIPFIGWLEDALVLYLSLKLFVKICPAEIIQRHVQAVDFISRLRRR
jgi:uncharacterized membrane protein YkvA (DUF1232 family)